MKRFTANSMTTPEYDRWWGQRINDNIPMSNQENTHSVEEHLQWQEQLHRSQDQVKDKDYVMGAVVTQVREVADHLQTLVVQVDVLSLKYESKSDRVRELTWLLRKDKALSIRARPYM
ncbi:hypothetical protein Golob_012240 [Gossypium lobatum]|uniref:Tektin n=1 Tax=Gossypium lobatum TaxID=34289 RepID=A0A7J8NDZ4_9ROSI|nr:hypothetical protein [Gossypium lobatum]